MRSQAKEKELFETTPVTRAIAELAFPSIMGQIILVIYNMADTFFVGLTRSDEMITAVTVCMPAFMFLSAISNLFGVGGASVISRFLGSHNRESAGRTSAFAIWGCMAVTTLYSFFAWVFMDSFVNLLGGGNNPVVHNEACRYMTVAVVIGGVVTALNTLFSHLVRAEGRSLQASIGIMLGGILNMALDPLFMFVILPRGNEVVGAALATMLSHVAALIYFIIIIVKNRRVLVLSAKPEAAMFRDKIPSAVISIGIPACLMTLCENISYAILDNLMSLAGTAQQAGIGVAKKVNMLAHCIVRGMSQGVLPLIGYNFASGNKKRMRKTFYISAGTSIVISALCMTACLLFAREFIGVFIPEASESHECGNRFLRILCIGAPFSAWAYAVISFFQATGHGVKSLVLALLRKGVLDIPLMFILHSVYPTYGIVWATPIADILCSICAAVLFTVFIKKHGHSKVTEPARADAVNTAEAVQQS